MDSVRGDLKSSNLNGTNPIKIVSTHSKSTNGGISVYDSNIYCSNYYRILMVTILPEISTKVIHTDDRPIRSVLYFHTNRKFIL